MASRFLPQSPHVDHLNADYPLEADLPALTSLDKTEEPCGRKLLLRFRMKKDTGEDGVGTDSLVSAQEANCKVESLEVVVVQPTQPPSPPKATQLGIVVPDTLKAKAKVVTATAKRNQKKRRFSFALSNEEIEADILAVSGVKLKRQPRKRSQKGSKEFDHLFPGFGMKF
ncbi:hypothetical protein SLEP1_g2743 [Rubroshorea leprosula]|uniref:Uncharacterized protein n=1 Tax=Rubroshorea leprosula TaxID=152421 RepID=A0AAV5HRV3_9ROSI|nr:hypothetical protein SLEP1_g2743 [Rubroshorea leprosula]